MGQREAGAMGGRVVDLRKTVAGGAELKREKARRAVALA
jgi:hypothetical protein